MQRTVDMFSRKVLHTAASLSNPQCSGTQQNPPISQCFAAPLPDHLNGITIGVNFEFEMPPFFGSASGAAMGFLSALCTAE